MTVHAAITGARRLRDRFPEWWALALSAVAWLAMLGHGTAACACHEGRTFSGELLAWVGMVVAMMVPTLVGGVRDVSLRSYRRRRDGSIALFLLGYLAPWCAVGLAVAWAAGAVPVDRAPQIAALAFAAAAGWALLRARTRWRDRAHAMAPFAPVGWRGAVDLLRAGARNGLPCVARCGPLMLACALSGHALVAMLGGAAVTAAEHRSFRLPRVPAGIAAALLAAWFLVGA